MNTKNIAVTGSKSLSEVVKAFLPDGGKFRLVIEGDATPVAGSFAKPTVRVAASDFFLALAGAGVVGEALLARAVEFAAVRAEGGTVDLAASDAAERLAKRAEGMANEWASRLPDVERPASVRVKGFATVA